jgi:glycyl-tRNA synthetase beta chain
MTTRNLLVELCVEELPPKALKSLGATFAATLAAKLAEAGLRAEDAPITPYASPRRLGVHLTAVRARADDRQVMQKLMPIAVAFDAAGQPTPALLKKLAALGHDASALARLERAPDGKGEALFLASRLPGATLQEGLQAALDAALAALPIPKVMSYQLPDGWTTVHFVRPAHKLVALFGSDVVPVRALGLSAGRETLGHRFEARHPLVTIREADSYAEQMEGEGAVIPSFEARRAEIVRQIAAAAAREGLQAIDDEALLDEVTALVERPNALVCQFDAAFLAVPQECLILTMKANQKYFPLLDGAGRLTNKFIVVANITPADPAQVIGGNERVVRPRLADAKFFFDQDRKKPLLERIPGLAKVVYHNKLGSQGERVQRLAALARTIGARLGSEALALAADRAALLAKADLLTDMVGEFPELQGVMGRYYALHDQEPAEIADAIEDHYKPRFAGDSLPRNDVGVCVALADKLETLAGLFGIHEKPTGDKDPFALRRHALGVIRMLIEKSLPLPLDELIDAAFAVFPEGMISPQQSELIAFIFERLANLLREQGYGAQEVDAVLALRPMRIDLVPQRLAAVRAFAALPEAAALAAANKRVGNILKKAPAAAATVDASLFAAEAERALYQALMTVQPEADAAFALGDYTESLRRLAQLKAPVDRFFDEVMVNVDDDRLRANRLGLLLRLQQVMNRVADLSRLSR